MDFKNENMLSVRIIYNKGYTSADGKFIIFIYL
jgi:hypothetical protein